MPPKLQNMICPRCGVSQRVSYKSYCSSCNKAKHAAWREKNRDYINERLRYNRTIDEEVIKKEYARGVVSNHVANGRLIKPDHCSLCRSSAAVEAHHHDYSKPLDIVWLCKQCHMKEHNDGSRSEQKL